MPLSPGVGKGAGPGGLWPPERRPGPAQREPRAGPRQGAAPTPPPGRWGGPRRGRSGKAQAGHGRRQGRQPHAQAATASDRATATTAERPGGGAAAPRTQAASNETGRRPTTGRGPRRQPPANTNGGEGPRAGAGQGRAAAIGAGAAGPGQYRPGLHPTGRIPYLAQPDTSGGGRATATGAAPAAGRSSARDSGRAEGPRGGRIRSRGHPSRSWGGVGGKKNAGRLAPRLDSDWTKKNAGRTLCPPRLPLQRIPDIPLFGVVVRNVLDAGQFHMLL